MTAYWTSLGLVCFFAFGAVLGFIVDEIRDVLRSRGEVAEVPLDDHAESAIALLGDDFSLWEKELSKR